MQQNLASASQPREYKWMLECGHKAQMSSGHPTFPGGWQTGLRYNQASLSSTSAAPVPSKFSMPDRYEMGSTRDSQETVGSTGDSTKWVPQETLRRQWVPQETVRNGFHRRQSMPADPTHALTRSGRQRLRGRRGHTARRQQLIPTNSLTRSVTTKQKHELRAGKGTLPTSSCSFQPPGMLD